MSSKTIAKNSMWSGLDFAVTLVFVVFGSVLVARAMGPEKLGRYNYLLFLASITGSFATFGVPRAAGKYAAEFIGRGDVPSAHTIVRAALRLQFALGLALVAIWLVWIAVSLQRVEAIYTAVAVMSILPQMLTSVISFANLAAEDFRSNVLASLFSATAGFLGILATIVFNWDLIGLTSTLLLSRILDCGLRHQYFKKYFPAIPPGARVGSWAEMPADLRSRIVRFCWDGIILEVINVVVWNRSQILFLERYCSMREISFYLLGFNLVERLGSVVRMFTGAVEASVMVRYGQDSSSAGRMTGDCVRYAALLALPLLVGAAAVSDPLIRVLYGQQYVAAIVPLALLALLSVPKVLLSPVRQLLVAGESQSFLVRWGLFSSAVVILLNWLLIPDRGAVGAAVACGLGQIVAAAGPFVVAAQRHGGQVPWRRVQMTGVAALLMGAVAASIGGLQPSYLGLPGAVLCGTVLFLCLLRWMGNLESQDRHRLLGIAPLLPAALRPALRSTVSFLSPAASDA